MPDGGEGRVAGAGVEGVIVKAMELRSHKRSGGVEDKGDGGSVVRGMTEEDANASSILPFVVRVLGL